MSFLLYIVPMVVAMETTGEEEADNEELDWEDTQEAMCPPGKHKWKHDLCMVCTVCRECTGFSISCLNSMRPDRNPGQWVNRICTVTLKYWLMILNSTQRCHHHRQLTFAQDWWWCLLSSCVCSHKCSTCACVHSFLSLLVLYLTWPILV